MPSHAYCYVFPSQLPHADMMIILVEGLRTRHLLFGDVTEGEGKQKYPSILKCAPYCSDSVFPCSYPNEICGSVFLRELPQQVQGKPILVEKV
jgi:hypothetical protein